ncbi:MAG: hypothetical protein K8T10_16280 [Candidatus Eremiobacteraeota bacterium]|nr:hypothetical protein [Candidatus Eremiobacteraeota bacterium]
MPNFGSFNPMKNPDIDRLTYYMGKIVNTAGEIDFNSIDANSLYVGHYAEGESDVENREIYFNINGQLSNNPGIRLNRDQTQVEFSSTGSLWRAMKWVTTSPGSGIIVYHSQDAASIEVNVGDIIDTSQGLKRSLNMIQCDFGSGESQVARGNHTHAYQLSDMSNVGSDTATDGNIIAADGTDWDSKTPDSAGLVTKTDEQTISGDKTLSGTVSFSGETSFSNNTSFTGDVTMSSALKTTSYVDIEEIEIPSNPDADTARLFVKDNGSGKTQLCVIFPTGNTIVIATES